MKRIRVISCLFSLVLLSLGLTAFTAFPAAADELNLSFGNTPVTMDPLMAESTMEAFYDNPCTGRLYRLNGAKKAVPELASSCAESEDGLVYTFTLREDAYYSDGIQIVADDFAYAWSRLVDPAQACGTSYLLTDACRVRNAAAILSREADPASLGVRAVDERTLVVELEEPCPYFLELICAVPFAPVRESFVESLSEGYGTSAETTLSSGPFAVDRFDVLGTQTHYSKNMHYPYVDEVKLDGLCIYAIPGAQQDLMAYRSGRLDLTEVSCELLGTVEGDPALTTVGNATALYLLPNLERSRELENVNIRTALSKAINRGALAQEIFRDTGHSLAGLIPGGFAAEADGKDFAADERRYADLTVYDPEEAAALMTKGLAETGNEALTLEILTERGMETVAQRVAEEWETALPGLTVKLHVMPAQQMFSAGAEGNFDILLTGWTADYPDPDAFLTIFRKGGAMDLGGWENETYEELLDKSRAETDEEKRMALLHEAEDEVMKDAAVIPFVSLGHAWLVSDKVSGMDYSCGGSVPECRLASKGEA